MPRPAVDGFGFPWKRNDACPCGKNKPFAECCLTYQGQLAMLVGSLVPSAPVTGYSHPKCYMKSSGNCSHQISREHYISRGLIDGGGLKIRGMPWQNVEVMRCSPDNLTAKILCRRHNSALSPLDAHAKTFFLALEQAWLHSTKRSMSAKSRYFLASGEALELWTMKTLAGLYASGIEFKTAEHRFRDFEPPMEEIAKQLASPSPRSLVTMSVPLELGEHEQAIGRRAVSIGPIIEADALTGLLVRMHGVSLFFRLQPAHATTLEMVRPDILDLNGPRRTSRIYLSWSDPGAEGQIIQLQLRARPKD